MPAELISRRVSAYPSLDTWLYPSRDVLNTGNLYSGNWPSQEFVCNAGLVVAFVTQAELLLKCWRLIPTGQCAAEGRELFFVDRSQQEFMDFAAEWVFRNQR